MRLRDLWLANYRALQDVAINFPDPGEMDIGIPLPPIHLLLGVNGTGKTAILRALAGIYTALDERRAPDETAVYRPIHRSLPVEQVDYITAGRFERLSCPKRDRLSTAREPHRCVPVETPR